MTFRFKGGVNETPEQLRRVGKSNSLTLPSADLLADVRGNTCVNRSREAFPLRQQFADGHDGRSAGREIPAGFKLLGRLRLSPKTELDLGLIHANHRCPVSILFVSREWASLR
jgi:hypothetical protein